MMLTLFSVLLSTNNQSNNIKLLKKQSQLKKKVKSKQWIQEAELHFAGLVVESILQATLSVEIVLDFAHSYKF